MSFLRKYSLICALCATLPAGAFPVKIRPRIDSTVPAGTCQAKVYVIDSKGVVTPVATNGVPFEMTKPCSVPEGGYLRVEADALDHRSITNSFDHAFCKANKDSQGVLKVSLTMERIREELPVTLTSLPNTTFSINGKQVEAATSFVFTRDGANWGSISVRAEAPNYEPVIVQIRRDDMRQYPTSNGRSVVNLDLAKRNLKDSLSVHLTANITGIEVESTALVAPPKVGLNGAVDLVFGFSRERSDADWSQAKLRVSKPGFDWAPTGQTPLLAFERTFTRAEIEALGGNLALKDFQPMKYVITRLLSYNVDNRSANLVTNDVWAAVSDSEERGSTIVRLVRQTKRTERLMVSSLSSPQKGGRLYFTMANFEYNQNSEPVLKGSTIYFSEKGILPTPLTTKPENQDMDPSVSPNGRLVVYSSFVGGTRCIRQVESRGGIGYPVSEDPRFIDTQPDITDRGRLVFTRRKLNAPAIEQSQIMVQSVDENGNPQAKLFGAVCDGHSPAWSPDGSKIAFIDPEQRLCLVSLDDGRVRPLLDGAVHASPSWDSLGKTLYFSAAKEQNERGQRHFDVFRVAVAEDGSVSSPEPLTNNSSLDTSPILSEESGEILFISNRGATRYGDDESLAIFSMKLR